MVVNHLLRERKKLHNQLLISPALCFLFRLNLPKYWYRIIANQMGVNVSDLAMGWRKLKSSETGRMQEERWSHSAVCDCHCGEGEIFKKIRCCRFLQTLFRQQPHSEEAQDAWTKSLPNMGPELSSSGFNNWSDQKDLIGHPSGICWEKKIRLTKFIEIAEHSCCRFLKRWCWVFAGTCYLPTGITVLWDLRLFIP